jgi:hypothetical protein
MTCNVGMLSISLNYMLLTQFTLHSLVCMNIFEYEPVHSDIDCHVFVSHQILFLRYNGN